MSKLTDTMNMNSYRPCEIVDSIAANIDITRIIKPASGLQLLRMEPCFGKAACCDTYTAADNESGFYFMPGFRTDNPGLDVYVIRKDFPILQRIINGRPLVWLDNAATTQKPIHVIKELSRYYSEYNSNIHRGAHTMAQLATDAYESARDKVRDFIGASVSDEIVFVRGATEAINLVTESYAGSIVRGGDEIILTAMEHHSNIVPWQKLKDETGAVIKVVPINDCGELMIDEYEKLLSPRTRIAAFTHVSNVLGTVNPVRMMAAMAHKHGAVVVVDGAQAVPHTAVDVKALDADFYVFSGHKVYGPTGIGVLYGKKALLDRMPPWQRGGGMIKNVDFNETSYNETPSKFEAGTPNIADAVGLGAAIDYVRNIGIENIERHEKELTAYTMRSLSEIPGANLIGTAAEKTGVIAFTINDISSEYAAKYLDQDGIAVRAGHHCAQPVLQRFGLTSAIRTSLGMYNTKEDIDSFLQSIRRLTGANR